MIRKQNSTLQKVNTILNTSSHTFMLIALVSLFALPFVIAKNLEPAVKQSNSAQVVHSVSQTETQQTPTPTAVPTTSSDVLGVSATQNPLVIKEQEKNKHFFTGFNSVSSKTSYSLKMTSSQVLEDVYLFSLKNDSDSARSYKVTIKDMSFNTRNSKTMFIDSKEVKIKSKETTTQVKADANEEISFYIASSYPEKTDITVLVTLEGN